MANKKLNFSDEMITFETECVRPASAATLAKQAEQRKAHEDAAAWLKAMSETLSRERVYDSFERKAKTVKDFFEILDGAEQYDAILRMAYATPKLAHKFANGDAYSVEADWMKCDDDFRTVAHEGYCDMAELVEKSPNLPLGKGLFRSVWNACRRQYRQYVKSVSALTKVREDEDEGEVYEVDLTSFASPSGKTPERIALFDATLEECCLDDRDNVVVSMKMDGFTDEEIGDFLGISRQAVSKRFKRFAERFLDAEHLSCGDRALTLYHAEQTLDAIRQAFKPVAEFAHEWRAVTSALMG